MIPPSLASIVIFIVFLIVNGRSSFLSSQKFAFPAPTKQMILIAGCTGTGKSTFGSEVATARGILKCISTDTIRQVLRVRDKNEAVHRSSYQGSGDPIEDWLECCRVLNEGIESLVDDSVNRGASMVLEGVHIVPDNRLLSKWSSTGGVAVGVVLSIPDAELHRQVIFRRGLQLTGRVAEEQMNKFNRIRAIHDEMVRLGRLNEWLIIEQRPSIDPRPMDLLNQELQNTYNKGRRPQDEIVDPFM